MLDVLDSGKGDNAPSKFRIALVDAGMVAQLTEEEGQRFIGLLTALGEGDGRAAAEFALQFSIENDISDEEMEKFKEEMCELFDKICKGYFSNVDVGEVLRGVLGLIRDHRVRIDANYATLVINLLCVESLARRICPTYNVLDASRPLLQTYRRICYQEDGFTPKSKDSYHKVRKLLNSCLYFCILAFEPHCLVLKWSIDNKEAVAIDASWQEEEGRQRVFQTNRTSAEGVGNIHELELWIYFSEYI